MSILSLIVHGHFEAALELLRDRAKAVKWALSYVPIRGGAPDDDEDLEEEEESRRGGTDDEEDEEEEDDGAAEELRTLRGELNRLRRELATARKAEKDRKRKEAHEAGDHDEIVRAAEEERDEAVRERDEVRQELVTSQREATVTKVAARLKFRDAADALQNLPADLPDDADAAAIERALKKVAKDKDYLIDGQGTRTGAPAGGGDPPTPKDLDEQIREAESKGDFQKSLELKNQKLLAIGG